MSSNVREERQLKLLVGNLFTQGRFWGAACERNSPGSESGGVIGEEELVPGGSIKIQDEYFSKFKALFQAREAAARVAVVERFKEKLEYALNPAIDRSEDEQERWEEEWEGMDTYDLVDRVKNDLLAELTQPEVGNG